MSSRLSADQAPPRRTLAGSTGTSPRLCRGRSARHAVRNPDSGRGQHDRGRLQRLQDRAGLLLGRLLLAGRRRDLELPRLEAVLWRPWLWRRSRRRWPWNQLRRSSRLLQQGPRQVDRSLPRIGLRSPGLGVWTSRTAVTWTTGACAHSGSSDDRESGWVDNDPTSPFYGRMYLTWNNFAAGRTSLDLLERWRHDLERAGPGADRRFHPQHAGHNRRRR